MKQVLSLIHILIVIPSDFSEKVLEVNAVNAEKTTVTYKVNAAGNSQVENEANKVAKDIVSDLNSQLVDMYMVSILSNLYTAQKNVETSNKKMCIRDRVQKRGQSPYFMGIYGIMKR